MYLVMVDFWYFQFGDTRAWPRGRNGGAKGQI